MGGTEFISRHLVESLLRRHHEVTVFNRGRRAGSLPAGVRTLVGDRKDHAALPGLLGGEDALLERHRREGWPVTIVRPTHVMGPLNTRNNETFFMDRIARGRPVLVPGDGGWLRQFGHVGDLGDAMAAMLGDPRTHGQAYNVMGDDVVTQVGFVELIAEVMGRPVALRHFDPALLKAFDKPGPFFGQNLVYDCHAVHTTGKLRTELGIRPAYTLAGGLRQTWEWYRGLGALDRPLDTAFEDALLAKLGA